MAPALTLAAGFLQVSDSLLAQLLAAVVAGYQQAPVLVIVLPVLLVLPVLALVSYLVHSGKRRKARRQAEQAALRRAEAGEWKEDAAPQFDVKAWPSQAWLTVEGKGLGTMPLAGQIVRIGRHKDNDIRLTDSSVHRYHAVIERTPEEEFVITDLSGKDGNGVRVNGARIAQARLADGDVIELGRMKLKFESSPA
jgi:pSer/pThr/pTyr-binding forkhead associated (FHA) protein